MWTIATSMWSSINSSGQEPYLLNITHSKIILLYIHTLYCLQGNYRKPISFALYFFKLIENLINCSDLFKVFCSLVSKFLQDRTTPVLHCPTCLAHPPHARLSQWHLLNGSTSATLGRGEQRKRGKGRKDGGERRSLKRKRKNSSQNHVICKSNPGKWDLFSAE